ncbi:hypothetical protein ABE021_03455 [Sporosarcina gallistercoris]|uniref:hypothetical protein n=1 Tax=Sporosarcina gallistercoris TaxID=2762245 RepID=UPI003D293B49
MEIRWGSFHMYWLIDLLVLSRLLAVSIQRVKLFHVAFILILTGAAYFLFFMAFTVGWMAIQGMLGFAVVLLFGVMLIALELVNIGVRRIKQT